MLLLVYKLLESERSSNSRQEGRRSPPARRRLLLVCNHSELIPLSFPANFHCLSSTWKFLGNKRGRSWEKFESFNYKFGGGRGGGLVFICFWWWWQENFHGKSLEFQRKYCLVLLVELLISSSLLQVTLGNILDLDELINYRVNGDISQRSTSDHLYILNFNSKTNPILYYNYNYNYAK